MITLATIILPRLEFHFLKEWVDHNLSLGVDFINIYDNGEFPVADADAHWLDEPWWIRMNKKKKPTISSKELVWDKKPNLDYFDHIPYAEIQDKLNELSDTYKEVSIIPWVCGEDHDYAYPESQEQMISLELTNNTGWFLNLDPDEFLHLPVYNNNLHNLINCNAEYNHFYFGQFIGESRKVGVPVSELTTYEGFRPLHARKWMCDLDRCMNFVGDTWDWMVHHLQFENPIGKTFSEDEVYFAHFRGKPARAKKRTIKPSTNPAG